MRVPALWSSASIADPYRDLRKEMDQFFNSITSRWPTSDVGIAAPAINVAETDGAVEITAEIPGVDQNDIKVTIDGNRIVIAGEKKQESDRSEKDWHVVERSYGSFHRAVALPFEPADSAVEAHYDKGVLHLTVKKPAPSQPRSKTIEIRSGAPVAKTP